MTHEMLRQGHLDPPAAPGRIGERLVQQRQQAGSTAFFRGQHAAGGRAVRAQQGHLARCERNAQRLS